MNRFRCWSRSASWLVHEAVFRRRIPAAFCDNFLPPLNLTGPSRSTRSRSWQRLLSKLCTSDIWRRNRLNVYSAGANEYWARMAANGILSCISRWCQRDLGRSFRSRSDETLGPALSLKSRIKKEIPKNKALRINNFFEI